MCTTAPVSGACDCTRGCTGVEECPELLPGTRAAAGHIYLAPRRCSLAAQDAASLSCTEQACERQSCWAVQVPAGRPVRPHTDQHIQPGGRAPDHLHFWATLRPGFSGKRSRTAPGHVPPPKASPRALTWRRACLKACHLVALQLSAAYILISSACPGISDKALHPSPGSLRACLCACSLNPWAAWAGFLQPWALHHLTPMHMLSHTRGHLPSLHSTHFHSKCLKNMFCWCRWTWAPATPVLLQLRAAVQPTATSWSLNHCSPPQAAQLQWLAWLSVRASAAQRWPGLQPPLCSLTPRLHSPQSRL